MIYCPNCGKKLEKDLIELKEVNKCQCGFIDFDNWVYISTVVAAFNNQGEFAMVRLKGKEHGKLTFPGGFRDLGETLEEAAKREFFEETGYRIDTPILFKAYTRDDLRLCWMAYTANIIGGHFVINNETSEVLFFSKKNPPNFNELRGNLTTNLVNELIK